MAETTKYLNAMKQIAPQGMGPLKYGAAELGSVAGAAAIPPAMWLALLAEAAQATPANVGEEDAFRKWVGEHSGPQPLQGPEQEFGPQKAQPLVLPKAGPSMESLKALATKMQEPPSIESQRAQVPSAESLLGKKKAAPAAAAAAKNTDQLRAIQKELEAAHERNLQKKNYEDVKKRYPELKL